MVRFTNVAYIFWSDERQACTATATSRFFLPSEPGGLPRLFGDTPLAALSGMTLILEVTPPETVVTPCRVVRLLLASVVESIFLRGALFGFGMVIISIPPSRLTFFFPLALAFGFDPVCLSSIARLAGVRGFPGGFPGGSGELGRGGGGAVVSTLLLLSLVLAEGALVDGALVLAEASERGARPRTTGAAGRGAGGATVGTTTGAPGAVAGASGRTAGAAIGGAAFGAAFGGGMVGGLTTPEFQGATLFGLLFFCALLYESNSRCCFLMISSVWFLIILSG